MKKPLQIAAVLFLSIWSAQSQSITISWDEVEGAHFYDLMLIDKSDPDAIPKIYSPRPGPTRDDVYTWKTPTSHRFSDIDLEKSYTIAVRSVRYQQTSDWVDVEYNQPKDFRVRSVYTSPKSDKSLRLIIFTYEGRFFYDEKTGKLTTNHPIRNE